MQVRIVTWAAITVLGAAPACHDSTAVVAASELGTLTFDVGMLGCDSGIYDTVLVQFGVTRNRDFPDSLIGLVVTESDSGSVHVVNSQTGNATFAVQARRFADGEDALAVRQYSAVPGGGGAGVISLESAWIAGGLSGKHVPDFVGYEIESFVLHLDRVRTCVGPRPLSEVRLRIIILGRPIR